MYHACARRDRRPWSSCRSPCSRPRPAWPSRARGAGAAPAPLPDARARAARDDRALRAGGRSPPTSSALPANERRALAKMVEAAQLMDALFLRQVWAGNETLLLELLAGRDAAGPRAAARTSCSTRGRGRAWTRTQPFLPGVAAQAADGGNFYPAGATKEEVEQWMNGPARGGAGGGHAASSPPSAARPTGKLRRRALQRRVPGRAGRRPRAAARGRGAHHAAHAEGVPRAARADAFLSNDYYASDVAWMELDASIEPTIGPYEVYEDEWFSSQGRLRGLHHPARRGGDGRSWRRFSGELQELEDHLPIDPKHAQPEAGRAGAHPRGQRRLLLRRRQPRRADRRLQPAQRRARRRRRRAASA